MDINYFLKKRTAFIRRLYTDAALPFADTQRKIVDGLPPFDAPPYSEDPEPPYFSEWLDAGAAREILALACVSLLSDTLKLYFHTLRERVICFGFGEEKPYKKGYVVAYREVLKEILDTDWSDCPADFEVIEQIVLARNQAQHGEYLAHFDSQHNTTTVGQFPKPFFANEDEYAIWLQSGGAPDSYLVPRVSVSTDALLSAIDHVEKLSDYIESRLDRAMAWRSSRA